MWNHMLLKCSLFFILVLSCYALPMLPEYEESNENKKLASSSSSNFSNDESTSNSEEESTVTNENITTSVNGLIISGVVFEIGVLENVDNITTKSIQQNDKINDQDSS